MQINRRLLNLFGMTWCGNEGSIPEPRSLYAIQPPGGPARFESGPDAKYDRDRDLVHVFTTNNDGFELWLGYPDQWLFHCSRRQARRLAWFILWTWMVRTDWFGVRRWAYYKALHSVVETSRRQNERAQEVTSR